MDPSCSRRLSSLSFGEFEKKEKERKCKPGDYTIQGSLWEFRLEDEKRCGVKKKGMKKKRELQGRLFRKDRDLHKIKIEFIERK